MHVQLRQCCLAPRAGVAIAEASPADEPGDHVPLLAAEEAEAPMGRYTLLSLSVVSSSKELLPNGITGKPSLSASSTVLEWSLLLHLTAAASFFKGAKMGSALAETGFVLADSKREDKNDLRDSFALNLRPLTGVKPSLLSLDGDGDRLEECPFGV